MKRPIVKTCKWCGNEFTAKSGNQKYCTAACASRGQYESNQAAYQKTKEVVRHCTLCGGELPMGTTAHCKYCSDCRRELRRNPVREHSENAKTDGRHNHVRYTHSCVMCREEFTAYSSKAKYCDVCQKRKQRNIQIAYLGKRDGRRVFKRECIVCGLPFNTFHEDRDTCSLCKKGTGNTKKDIKPPPPTLAEQVQIIAAYNREHGTNLSYGKYKAMMRAKEGEARVEVKL